MRTLLARLLVVVPLAACSSSGEKTAGDSERADTTSTTTTASTAATSAAPDVVRLQEYGVPAGSRPHDVAVAADGRVWYTAQGSGELGRLDPATGDVEEVDLGDGSRPQGVVVGPDGAAWVTDGGLDAIVRVDGSGAADRRTGDAVGVGGLEGAGVVEPVERGPGRRPRPGHA